MVRRVAFAWLLLATLVSIPAKAETVALPKLEETLLSVRAEGYATAIPDVMRIEAGAITRGATAAEALNANNALIANILESLRKNGLPLKDVQTDDFALKPIMAKDQDDGERSPDNQILAYEARNELSVTLRDVATAGKMMGLMFEAGANSVKGPYFSISDPSPAVRKAERNAIGEARVAAENFADALGMKISRVVRVYDREVDYEDYDRGSRMSIVVTGSRISPTPIEPGEMDLSVEVQIEFALVPK
jgi:uncharacterized protein